MKHRVSRTCVIVVDLIANVLGVQKLLALANAIPESAYGA
jgi:hypothetical protein